MTQPVLLTGATGFIGAAVLRALRSRGKRVVAIARRAPLVKNDPGVVWLEMDLLDAMPAELERVLGELAPDSCIHTAWYTDHSNYLDSNLNSAWYEASVRFADAFYRCGGRHLLGLGTCLEYDRSGSAPLRECDTAPSSAIPYAAAKAALHAKFTELGEMHGRVFTWARIFFVYGPGDRAGRLVPFLVDRLRRGETAAVTFGGLIRDYVHIDDLAMQLCALLDVGLGGAFNTGSGEALSLARMFEIAADLVGRPDLVTINAAVGDRFGDVIVPDMSRFHALLGCCPSRTLRQGLAELLDVDA